jgi:preprotein translocase subunit SecA
VVEELVRVYNDKFSHLDHDAFHSYSKTLMLSMIDQRWREHLQEMANLRQGIGLRGYAQKNPIQEYKRESFELFQTLLDSVKYEIISMLSKLEIQEEKPESEPETPGMSLNYLHDNKDGGEKASDSPLPPLPEGAARSVGRNQPCPCGSNKKYKHCHGRIA